MPYAYGAKIEHEFDTDHLNIWLTFRRPMDQDLKPPLALWLLEADDVVIDIVDSAWQDEFTLLLTSDTIASHPVRVLLEYTGPNSNLQTTWGKDWEPWGPILSTDIGRAQCFVDRGDPAAVDFNAGDFTIDGTWRDLDLSSIVPVGAKAVELNVAIRSYFVNAFLAFRKNGNTNTSNRIACRTQISNQTIDYQGVVAIDENRKIEYGNNNTAFMAIEVTVISWWF